MKEQLVTFKTAKLAKDKGFDWECHDCFSERGHLYSNGWCERLDDHFESGFSNSEIERKNFSKKYYTRPTQSLLQKWLYEKHQIWVNSRPVYNANEQMGIEVDISSWRFPYKVIGENDQFDVYAGLEKGLQEALKLIK
tara:strand:- start:20755 stop:21168 length:414 start_codon:yes stop_codon:yes gene_type:complete